MTVSSSNRCVFEDGRSRPILGQANSCFFCGVGAPSPLAVLNLLFGVLVEILSEFHDHEDGDDRPEGTLHVFECLSCFHDVFVLKC